MIDLGSSSWLIKFGEVTPRRIEFAPDQTFKIEDDHGTWSQSDRTLTLSGDFLPVPELRLQEDGNGYLLQFEPPISIRPGVDRRALLRLLRRSEIPTWDLLDIEQMETGPDRQEEIARLIRRAVMLSGFFYDDHYFQSSPISMLLIIGRTAQIPSLDFDNIFPIRWMDDDNKVVEFEESDDWFAFYQALHEHIEVCHFNCQRLKQLIAAGQPYNLNSGWPKTRLPIADLIGYLSA